MMNYGLKILIVEDEAVCATLLSHYMIEMGHRVCKIVARGGDAIRAAREYGPDVVLMDVRLTDDIDGIEAAEKILGFSGGVSIVFMSAYSDDEIIARANKLNPAAYLCKPFEFEEMQAVIENIQNKLD